MSASFIAIMNQLDPTVWGSFFALGYGVILFHFVVARGFGAMMNMVR